VSRRPTTVSGISARLLFEGDVRAFLFPVAMTVGTIPLSTLFCWLYNSSGFSLLPPMLFHASFNATLSVLGLVWTERSALLIGAELTGGLCVLALLVVIRCGGKRLSRQ